LINRGMHADKRLKEQGVKLHSVFRMENLLWFWLNENFISERDYQNSMTFLFKKYLTK